MGVKLDGGLVERVDGYVERLFVPRDEALAQGLADATAAGLPEIAVSPNEGKLLYLLARLCRPRRILEIGTLGGYSTTWLARALEPGGNLLTLELDPHHAEVARKNLARAGVGEAVEVRIGPAAPSLRALIAAGEPPFDVVFIDADKEGYPEYLDLSLALCRPGSLILADNLIRGGAVLDGAPDGSLARGVRAFNAQLAANPRLEALVVPIFREHLDGLGIALVKG